MRPNRGRTPQVRATVGPVKWIVAKTFPLESAAEALQHLVGAGGSVGCSFEI